MTNIMTTLIPPLNLENMTAYEMNAIATFIVQKGVGFVICPRCNELNLVRYNRLQCCCGFIANTIDCACGCGLKLLNIGNKGRLRRFIAGL
jgi:hypothetical protein